jgi:hypothetical protein
MDAVGILDAASTSRSYGAITFRPTAGTGTVLTGSTVVNTSTWVATYAGRIAKNTGESSSDWLASVLTGTPATQFTLSATQSTAFAGQSLNHVGGPNYWAPFITNVFVNDGSSSQHSQVSELTITFSEAVTIASATAFSIVDSNGIPLSINILTASPINGGTPLVFPATGVLSVVITFNNSGSDTFAYATGVTDPLGNSVGLNDGNYFLHTDASQISNNGKFLDWQHNGNLGNTTGTESDEFWRFFGDATGQRLVNSTDNVSFLGADHSVNNSFGDSVASATRSPTGLVTMTMASPSLFAAGELVTISGVTIGGNASNPYNGTFTILSVVFDGINPTQITYQAASTPTASADPSTGSAAVPTYLWYLDFNEDGLMDTNSTLDHTAFSARLGHRLLP